MATAYENRVRIGVSQLKESSKEAVNRRITFVAPKSLSCADSHGFTFPETFFTEPDEVRKLLGWKEMVPRGAGLRNCGNTCYLNSVLQALTHSSALANDALTEYHTSKCARLKAKTFCGYCSLLKHIRQALTASGRAEIAPDAVVRNLKLIAKNMRLGRQEDSHEFLRQLVDSCMTGELPMRLTSNPKGPLVAPLVRSTTFLGQLFSGHLESQISCLSCGFVSRTFDPFMDISLEIQSGQTLTECLRQFSREDLLVGGNVYKCSKCQKRVSAKKQMTVHRSPPCLTLQLKRFNLFSLSRHQAQKISKHVKFDAMLNMAPYLSEKSDTADLSYALYAVIVHEGSSMGSGHYVCYAKAANGLWYLFNDSSVRQVSESHVLAQQAYILMYESSDPRCLYPSETTPEKSSPVLGAEVTVATPTAELSAGKVTVVNADFESESENEEEEEAIAADDGETPTALTLSGSVRGGPVPRAGTRKLMRILGVMSLLKKKRKLLKRPQQVHAPNGEAATTTTNKWGSIPVATWGEDEQLNMVSSKEFRSIVSKQAEPGARSMYDVDYDKGKSMHNPRGEFASGKALPPTLKDSFNEISKGNFRGSMGYSQGGKGKGKGSFSRGKGKGKGSFNRGKGKGKGSFSRGKGKGGAPGRFRNE